MSKLFVLRTELGGVVCYVRQAPGASSWGISPQRERAAVLTKAEAKALQLRLWFATTTEPR